MVGRSLGSPRAKTRFAPTARFPARKGMRRYIMNIRAQVSSVFHLDKCIGCHTCSIACKNLWTDRKGAEYMWWNNVETKPGTGYPTQWEDQEKYQRRLGDEGAAAAAQAGRARRHPGQDLPQSEPADHGRLLRAVHLQIRRFDQCPGRRRSADRPAGLDGYRQADEDRSRAELGRRPLRLQRLCRQRSRGGQAQP